MELDKDGALISYEEYHPYGTTAYQVIGSGAEVSLKRYRYTGKERDEESGLYYHGARYYAAWLARWTSCDPKGVLEGLNLYRYVSDNPIKLMDPNGAEEKQGVLVKAWLFGKGLVKGEVQAAKEFAEGSATGVATLLAPPPDRIVLPIAEPNDYLHQTQALINDAIKKGEVALGGLTAPFYLAKQGGENLADSVSAAQQGKTEEAGEKAGKGLTQAALAIGSAVALAKGVGGIVRPRGGVRPRGSVPESAPVKSGGGAVVDEAPPAGQPALKPTPDPSAPKPRTAAPTNWPEGVDFKRVQEALEGKRSVSELSAQERELAAKFYRDTVPTIKEGKGATQGYDFKVFNEERARFLKEGGPVPPGKITDFTKRTK